MPLRVEDPLDWAASMSPEIQQQIFEQMGSDADPLPGSSTNSATGRGNAAAPLNWGGLTPGDIGGDLEFGADDVFNLGLSALGSLNANGSVMSNTGNLINWGLRQLPNLVSVGELGGGFGAENIGSPIGDLADMDTLGVNEFLGTEYDPFGL